MAAFVPVADKTTTVPNIVNSYSDTTQPLANKTAGAALEGVSNLFDETVKAESGREDRDMGRRANELVDAKRKEVGVDDAAMNSRLGLPVKGAVTDNEDNFGLNPNPLAPGAGADAGTSDATDFSGRKRTPSDDSAPLPPAAEALVDRASRTQRAVLAGKIGNTEYSAGLEAIVRQLRAEYPGSRDEIDQKISQITGQTPANALRASMLRDQITAERAANSAATYERNYRDKNAKYAPDLVDAPFAVFRHAVVGAMGQEHAVTQAAAGLSLDAAKGADLSSRAEKVTIQANSIDADRMVTQFGSGIQKLLDRKLPDGSTQPLSNKEIEQLRPQMNVMRASLSERFEANLDRPVDYDPAHPEYKGQGPTLRTLIKDSNKVAGLKKDMLSRVDDLEKRLTDGNFGSFEFNANSAKASVASADAGLMRNEHLAILASVQTRFGPNVANLVVGDNSTNQAALPLLQKTILDAGKLQAVTKGGDTPSETAQKVEDTALLSSQPPVTARTYREQMRGLVQTMTSKDIPDEAKAEAVSKVVHDAQYIYKFNAGYGQVEAYTTLTSPAVTDSVKALSLPDPKIWLEYKAAAVRNFTGVFKVEADQANTVNKVEGFHTVFDPKSYRFDVIADKGRGPIEDDARKANLDVYQARLDGLNKGLRSLSYVLGKDHEDVAPQILKIATAMGFDPKSPKEGFWDGVANAVGKSLKKADEDISTVFEKNIR